MSYQLSPSFLGSPRIFLRHSNSILRASQRQRLCLPQRQYQRQLPTLLRQSSSLPPPPPRHLSRWRRFLQTLGRVTLGTLVVGSGTLYYFSQKDRHPGNQLPHDDSKPTLVVLGSGWAATSLLKNMDTEGWNVVCLNR